MPTVRTYRRAVAWCAAVLLICTLCSPAAAQQSPAERFDRFTNPLTTLQQNVTTQTSPLEGAVDPEHYLVGPGDIFSVYIGGSQPVTLRQVVSADGRLVLPEVPGLPVAGRPLQAVQQEALEALRQRFRNVTLDVALVQPRQFYVHVAGAVPTPGRFVATPVARVSTVLAQAFADSTKRPVDNPDFRPSLRTIAIRHADGTTESVDLRRYFATGDTRHDPYLRDGDVVSVPAYDIKREAVYVDGAVAFPGVYAYRPGDTVLDLLALATGTEDASMIGSVRLTHIGENGQQTTETIDIDHLGTNGTPAPPLAPLDHVFVPLPRTERGVVTVTGAVQQPGTYPITDGETTLQEVMQLIDLRHDALLRGAYLERSPLRTAAAVEQNRRRPTVQRMDGTSALRPIRADSAAILQATRLSEFDFTTRAFLQQEMRLQNRVSLDLTSILNGSSQPVALRDGDRLVIPHDEQTVYVFGQVNRPGFVRYEPGWEGSDYITAVGGLGQQAADAYVIEAGTGRYVELQRADVQSGDMIFVNREDALANTEEMQRLLLEERRTRADSRSRRIQAIVQSVSAVATIITTYIAIQRL